MRQNKLLHDYESRRGRRKTREFVVMVAFGVVMFAAALIVLVS
jgi:hypothetical protein